MFIIDDDIEIETFGIVLIGIDNTNAKYFEFVFNYCFDDEFQ